MSQFSEMMGSFIRTGSYPLEAHYIFPTEEALKEFYSDEMNATTIHKGLLRIVENDGTGKQGLYWVTKKQTNDELEFTKLISGTNIEDIFAQLLDLEKRLTAEIKNRKDSEAAIWGTTDPTNVVEELNSIYDLANVVTEIKKEIEKIHKELIDLDDSNYKSLKTEIKAVAGTQEYNVVEYLKSLPYKSLTEAAAALNKFLNEVDETSNLINTLPELKFFLEGYDDKQKLRHVLLDLQKKILGDPIPSKEFITLRAIEDFVRVLKTDLQTVDRNLQSELDRTQVGVGLSGDGSYSADLETYYLKDATSIMNALKTLDSLMYEAISGITIGVENKDAVDLAVRKELEGYIVSAKLKLSNQLGNDLIKKEDGLYFNVSSTYKNGILSLYANNKLIALHVLGFSSVVDDARYDPSQEALVMVFKLLDGEKQTVTIPVGALIREWDVDNAQPDKVVELTRTVVINGEDTLSADIRLWSDKNNILKKYGNTLGVEGTSENITHNGQTLKLYLDALRDIVVENNTALNNKIEAETRRASAKEGELEASITLNKSDLDKAVLEVNRSIDGVNSDLKNEINRATGAENGLQSQVNDLKLADSEIRKTNELHNTKINSLEKLLGETNADISLERLRAIDAEAKLEQRIKSIDGELSDVSKRQTILDSAIQETNHKIDNVEKDLRYDVHLVLDSIDEKIANKAEKSDLDSLALKVERSSEKIDKNSDDIKELEKVVDEVKEDVKNVSTENFYTKKEVQDMISNKADLVDGKISPDQMSFYIIDIE